MIPELGLNEKKNKYSLGRKVKVQELEKQKGNFTCRGRKVPPKASKVTLRFFQFQDLLLSSLKMYFFKGKGFDLLKEARNEAAKRKLLFVKYLQISGRGLDLSLQSELQYCKNSLKVSRSSTENSRPKACYFPNIELNI